jgi:hypothetical protein
MPPPHAEQRNRAQGYAGHDPRASRRLQRAHRVAEGHHPGQRADQRLQVEEGSGHLSRDPGLPVGEQGERDQRARDGQGQRGQHRAGRRRYRRQSLGHHGVHQRGQGSAEELDRGDRDRVPALQDPVLGHGERGRDQQREQHQAVTGGGGAAPVPASDQGHSAQ